MSDRFVGRWILSGRDIVEGCLRVNEGIIEEVCWGQAPTGSEKAVILPAFTNAHTHLGDAFAYPAPRGTVDEVVAPPDGFKHRMLRSACREDKVQGMRRSAEVMRSTGTALFADFREEGIEGVKMLREGVAPPPHSIVLGRPLDPSSRDHELRELLKSCAGFGVSSLRDWPYDLLIKMSRMAHEDHKLFALHSSEIVREDIDRILDLKPDFLVHMTAASTSDLDRCAQEGVPIVVCPRSNDFFGIDPRIPVLIAAGLEVALGTDNAMISPPNMLDEVLAAIAVSSRSGSLKPADALYLATIAGQKVLNAEREITTEIECEDALTVVGVGEGSPCGGSIGSEWFGPVISVCAGGRLRRN